MAVCIIGPWLTTKKKNGGIEYAMDGSEPCIWHVMTGRVGEDY